jgi:hypothetical protein
LFVERFFPFSRRLLRTIGEFLCSTIYIYIYTCIYIYIYVYIYIYIYLYIYIYTKYLYIYIFIYKCFPGPGRSKPYLGQQKDEPKQTKLETLERKTKCVSQLPMWEGRGGGGHFLVSSPWIRLTRRQILLVTFYENDFCFQYYYISEPSAPRCSSQAWDDPDLV